MPNPFYTTTHRDSPSVEGDESIRHPDGLNEVGEIDWNTVGFSGDEGDEC